MTPKTDYIYGLHAVNALLNHHPDSIIQLKLLAGREDDKIEAIIAKASALGLPIKQCSRAELDQLTDAVHQGVIAECKAIKLEKTEGFLTQLIQNLDHPPLLLVLDGVTDPHNLGACLRSAEAAGVDAVIVPKDKSALMSSTVRKVASGAAEIVPFIVVTNLARCLQNLQKMGLWVLGTAGEADMNIYQADLKGPIALVLGSEGKGLRRLTRENCDALLSIPMSGELSSLNISVSAGICLFEAVRQRKISA
jgi:23S rRNA (guanosine2251-2'-O)-methyltransferase